MTTADPQTDVVLHQLEAQPLVSIRGTVPIAQLGAAMGERLKALTGYLRSHGVQPTGAPCVRYHSFGETEADFELGIPVERAAAGEGEIVSGLLPGGPAATTWHLGAHDRLGEAYSRIQTWLQAQSREPSGPAWEVYSWIDLASDGGPEHWPEPTRWRTQLVQPLT